MLGYGFLVPNTDKKIIISIARQAKPVSPYDLKQEVGFSYTGVAKRCRELESEGYLTSYEYEGSTKGRKIDYSITLKGCALAIGLLGTYDSEIPDREAFKDIYSVLEKNQSLSEVFVIWKAIFSKIYLKIQNNDEFLNSTFDKFIHVCFLFSGIRSRLKSRSMITNFDEDWFIKYLFFETISLIFPNPPQERTQIQKQFYEIYIEETSKQEKSISLIKEAGKRKIFDMRRKADQLECVIEQI